MCKKWRITGLNKLIAFALVLLMLAGLPVSAAKVEDFTDLNPREWYYEEVGNAIAAGLFAGESPTEFNPEGEITRAEFATALSRLCGAEVAGYTTDRFIDVLPEDWFYPYVSWIYAVGLTDGTSPNEFSPEKPINRQEMSKMLGSAIEKVFLRRMTQEGAAAFADQAAIDSWALDWVKKCNANGLFLGDEENRFNPKDNATRAQAAAVFYRCFSNPALMPEEPQEPLPEDGSYAIRFGGFQLDFDVDTDYYLVHPADFSACSILEFSGFKALTVQVEQYAGYYPYKSTPYQLGTPLQLGHGRAKVTLTATLKDGSTREYLIALTDPDSADYSYARTRVNTSVNLRAKPNTSSAVLAQLKNNIQVYYLGTEGDWCKVQLLKSATVGYIHKDYLRREWQNTEMPEAYKAPIEALQKAHPNWTFEFVDLEMSLDEALAKYGVANERYINPIHYLAEDKIFAMLDIDTYDPLKKNEAGIKAMWVNESAFSKDKAAEYFLAAGESLLMNPVYVTCRAILESGYGTSKFAQGTVPGFEGYYNFFGIRCYTAEPEVGAAYAKERNWNSVFRSIVEGANWVKDGYLDQGAHTPYFFRFRGFQNKNYMDDVQAPQKEASILKRAYASADAEAHFIIPVYR